jgi:hypothetical protein
MVTVGGRVGVFSSLIVVAGAYHNTGVTSKGKKGIFPSNYVGYFLIVQL